MLYGGRVAVVATAATAVVIDAAAAAATAATVDVDSAAAAVAAEDYAGIFSGVAFIVAVDVVDVADDVANDAAVPVPVAAAERRLLILTVLGAAEFLREGTGHHDGTITCLLYTSPSPRD